MNIELEIFDGSPIDANLEVIWQHTGDWVTFIKSLPEVLTAERIYNIKPRSTIITFETEEHKNWFLLKYS